MNAINRIQFLSDLQDHVSRYTDTLETLLGPRRRGFVFGTILRSDDDCPSTHFPEGFRATGCVVNVLISPNAWDTCYRPQATWQVAHECVHLLDPGLLGTTNFLEEGLATWFQDEPRYHEKWLHEYIPQAVKTHSNSYKDARQLVLQANPVYLLPAVKRIRETGTLIRDITPDVLAREIPKCEARTVERLCERFGDGT